MVRANLELVPIDYFRLIDHLHRSTVSSLLSHFARSVFRQAGVTCKLDFGH